MSMSIAIQFLTCFAIFMTQLCSNWTLNIIDLFDVPVTQIANSVDKWHLNARLDHRLHLPAIKRSKGGPSGFPTYLPKIPVTTVQSYTPSSSSTLIRNRHPANFCSQYTSHLLSLALDNPAAWDCTFTILFVDIARHVPRESLLINFCHHSSHRLVVNAGSWMTPFCMCKNRHQILILSHYNGIAAEWKSVTSFA
jgi:hypothetical protein